MPVGTADTHSESALWQGTVDQARAAVKKVSAEARRHHFELLVLAATMGFVLVVVLLALAVLI